MNVAGVRRLMGGLEKFDFIVILMETSIGDVTMERKFILPFTSNSVGAIHKRCVTC